MFFFVEFIFENIRWSIWFFVCIMKNIEEEKRLAKTNWTLRTSLTWAVVTTSVQMYNFHHYKKQSYIILRCTAIQMVSSAAVIYNSKQTNTFKIICGITWIQMNTCNYTFHFVNFFSKNSIFVTLQFIFNQIDAISVESNSSHNHRLQHINQNTRHWMSNVTFVMCARNCLHQNITSIITCSSIERKRRNRRKSDCFRVHRAIESMLERGYSLNKCIVGNIDFLFHFKVLKRYAPRIARNSYSFEAIGF